MSLSWFVVRVLPDNNYFHLIERAEVEGIEDKRTRRIAGTRLVFLPHLCRELLKIRFLKLSSQLLFPGWFYLYIHGS